MRAYPKSTGPMKVTRDAAAYIGMSEGWLEKRPEHGPPYIKLGRKVVYRVSDLDGWLDERARKTARVAA